MTWTRAGEGGGVRFEKELREVLGAGKAGGGEVDAAVGELFGVAEEQDGGGRLTGLRGLGGLGGGAERGDDRQERDQSHDSQRIRRVGALVELPPDGGGLHLHAERAGDRSREEQAEVPKAEDRRQRVHGSNVV